jgi:CRISPR/Cas system-associated exonuclease Cas4 (RecB family)
MRLSYSMYSTYAECPFKYRAKYLLKIKAPFTGPAAERGNQIHTKIEHYIRGIETRLPWDAERPVERVPALGTQHPMQGVADRLKNWPSGDRHVERKLGFDIDWDLYPHDADEAAYMVVLDAAGYHNGTVEVAEWKSGKPYESHAEQRLLYGLAALRTWLPKKVTVTTYYVDMTGPAKRITITQDNEQELKDMWSSRRETIVNDKILAPRPNSRCQWCFYRKSNGGPCPMSF